MAVVTSPTAMFNFQASLTGPQRDGFKFRIYPNGDHAVSARLATIEVHPAVDPTTGVGAINIHDSGILAAAGVSERIAWRSAIA